MKYISIIDEDIFCFKDSEIHNILESDREVADVIYNHFFINQSKGKQYKVKNILGTTFEEIFKEVIQLPQVEEVKVNTFEERLGAIEIALAEQMGG